MAKNTNRIALLAFALLALACGGKAGPDSGPGGSGEGVLLHTVWDMDTSAVAINSHAGDELTSVLQPIWSKFQKIPHIYMNVGVPADATEQKFSCYPRIKLMADGNYLLLYHSGRLGSRIWCRRSSDFLNWTPAEMLYEPVSVDVPEGNKTVQDWRRFVNPDAVVLKHNGAMNGDILMVCSYRATKHYDQGIDCGLSFRRSTNNGKTWSKPTLVPVGANWEAYLLELPDGTIHCYYTDATPQTRNSGTSLIVSTDGGYSWSEKIRVSRQFKYTYRTNVEEKKQYNGEKIFTDQMPCFRLLNDGRTIMGWLEARIENPAPPTDCGNSDTYNSHCEMSLVYNDGFTWQDLGENSAGPARRKTNIMRRGAGGYVVTYPSGEVFISCGLYSLFHIRLGDAAGENWYGNSDWLDDANWTIPFKGTGYWGCMETCGSNMMAVGMHEDITENNPGGMQLGMYYLNQRQKPSEQDIEIDGDASEWLTDKGWFIADTLGDEVFIRSAISNGKLCFAVERKDASADDGSTVNIILSRNGGTPVNARVGLHGLVASNASGAVAATNPATAKDGSKGYVCELAIPLSSLGVSKGGSLRCLAVLEKGNVRTMFSFANGADSNTWQLIRL